MKKMSNSIIGSIAIVAATAMPTLAQANDDLRVNGFLTIGVGQVDTDELEVGGYSDSLSMNNDTIMGLQFTKPINDWATFNTQLTARTGEPYYEVQATWAFVSLQATESINVRAGRIRLPFYMYSEFVDVTYAYPWIRSPEALTGKFSDFDGVEVVYSTFVGDADLTLQAYTGRYESNGTQIADTAKSVALENMFGAVATLTYGPVTGRVSAHTLKVVAEDVIVSSGYTPDVDLAGSYFVEAGLIYDDSSNFLFAEYTNTIVPDELFVESSNTTIIATAGHRFGSLMPLVTYEANNRPDQYQFSAYAGEQKLNTSSIIAGLRWDFAPSASMKAQYQMSTKDDQGTETSGNLMSASIDMVF
jgi:hypothetical protein